MNPQLVQQLMQLFGYTPEQQTSIADSALVGGANALTLNQLPRIAAAGQAAFTDQTYEDALSQAYAGRQAMKEQNPYAYGGAEIATGLLNPLDKLNKFGKLARLGNAAGQAALYETGEQTADASSVGTAALMGGGASSLLELFPLAGKYVKKAGDWASEAGLDIKRSSARKAMKNVENKSLVKEGYEQLGQLIESGQADPKDVAEYSKIFTSSANRIDAADRIVSSKIDKLTKQQKSIVEEAEKQYNAALAAQGQVAAGFTQQPIKWDGKSFNDALTRKTGGGGKLNPKDFPDAEKFSALYKEAVQSIGNKFAKGDPVTLEDLFQAKKALNATGDYSQTADALKKEAYTAAIHDINRSIDDTISDYAQKGLISPDLAGKFSEAGKMNQKLISFKDSLSSSLGRENFMAQASDMTRAAIGGSTGSIIGYAMGLPWQLATAIGAATGTPTGMGVVGAGLQKAANAGTAAAALDPLARQAITTGVGSDGNMSTEPIVEAPAVDANFGSFLDTIIAPSGMPATTGQASAAPQPSAAVAQQPDFNSFLDTMLSPQNDAASQAPQVNSLPSSPPAGQAVSLSGDPMTPYFAALAQHESSMNPMAQNPNSTAKGLFQFIDDTAKRTGLENAYDANQSLKAVQNLTAGHRQVFGDNPDLLYAAHYLGQPTLQTWLGGGQLEPKQAQQVAEFSGVHLPRWQQNYAAAATPQSDIVSNFLSLYPAG